MTILATDAQLDLLSSINKKITDICDKKSCEDEGDDTSEVHTESEKSEEERDSSEERSELSSEESSEESRVDSDEEDDYNLDEYFKS